MSVCPIWYGQRQAKKCFRPCAKCADSYHLAHAQSIIWPLPSIHTFCSILRFCKRAVNALIRLRRCAGWSGPSLYAYAERHVFAWRGPYNVWRLQIVPANYVALSFSPSIVSNQTNLLTDTDSSTTIIGAETSEMYLLVCAPNEDSDQPAHPHSLISVSVLDRKKLCILAVQNAPGEDSDQPAHMLI